MARRLVRRGDEVRIAKTSTTTSDNHHALFAGDNIGNQVTAGGVKDCRSWWYADL
jgi:hypothetical protein